MKTPTVHTHKFELVGTVEPLVIMAKAANGHRPTRGMGGWLMTYGKIGSDGRVTPTVDRDDQIMEAAKELGHVDWSAYLRKGVWNDTHDEDVLVGLPSSLEFHDSSTELAKGHGKVGFWTTGHLWDRNDPASWTAYGEYVPSPRELDRADHFWTASQMLKGTHRPLALSAHGRMALSPCRKRITFCEVTAAAVCELPKNPDATLEPLRMSTTTPLDLLRKGMIGRPPCGKCVCPAGSCEGLLKKAVESGGTSHRATVTEDLEGAPAEDNDLLRLVEKVAEEYNVTIAKARQWVRRYLLKRKSK